jgi:putative redox protein
MAIVAERHGVELRGMTVQVSKEMADAPRRIGRLTTEVHIPLPADHPQRELLEKTALGCPVHRSLAAEMERPTEFFWEG